MRHEYISFFPADQLARQRCGVVLGILTKYMELCQRRQAWGIHLELAPTRVKCARTNLATDEECRITKCASDTQLAVQECDPQISQISADDPDVGPASICENLRNLWIFQVVATSRSVGLPRHPWIHSVSRKDQEPRMTAGHGAS
ncbi:MAG: hypothetical protein HY290_01315 [Planctomycetia bacterium]|nr:hypothetical protein [Planctomycetia bacterium]